MINREVMNDSLIVLFSGTIDYLDNDKLKDTLVNEFERLINFMGDEEFASLYVSHFGDELNEVIIN